MSERGYPPEVLIVIVSMLVHVLQEIVVLFTGCIRRVTDIILAPPRARMKDHVRLSRQAELTMIELKANRVPLAAVIWTVDPPGL